MTAHSLVCFLHNRLATQIGRKAERESARGRERKREKDRERERKRERERDLLNADA